MPSGSNGTQHWNTFGAQPRVWTAMSLSGTKTTQAHSQRCMGSCSTENHKTCWKLGRQSSTGRAVSTIEENREPIQGQRVLKNRWELWYLTAMKSQLFLSQQPRRLVSWMKKWILYSFMAIVKDFQRRWQGFLWLCSKQCKPFSD